MEAINELGSLARGTNGVVIEILRVGLSSNKDETGPNLSGTCSFDVL